MRFDQNTADALQTVCPAVQPPLPLRLQLRHHPASVPTPTPPCPSARSSSLHPLCHHPVSCQTVPPPLTPTTTTTTTTTSSTDPDRLTAHLTHKQGGCIDLP